MPTTRSASGNTTRPRRSPRKAAVVHSEIEENKHSEANVVGVDGVVEEESDSDEESVVQIQLKSFARNLKKLETNLKEMRKQNQKLQRQLDVYKDGAPTTPKKRAAANVETTIKIQEMEERIKELERIQQRELKVEAKDLNRGGFVDNVGDPDGFTTMRKASSLSSFTLTFPSG
ncbi:hypothetical protein AN958_05444 [Leucoagaricus sp. SymC.cos]|nr:hypothetical protein AN958_05444 [Leucoagaricus sp. SymC.cos]